MELAGSQYWLVLHCGYRYLWVALAQLDDGLDRVLGFFHGALVAFSVFFSTRVSTNLRAKLGASWGGNEERAPKLRLAARAQLGLSPAGSERLFSSSRLVRMSSSDNLDTLVAMGFPVEDARTALSVRSPSLSRAEWVGVS